MSKKDEIKAILKNHTAIGILGVPLITCGSHDSIATEIEKIFEVEGETKVVLVLQELEKDEWRDKLWSNIVKLKQHKNYIEREFPGEYKIRIIKRTTSDIVIE